MNEQEAIAELHKIYIDINDCRKYPVFEVAYQALEKQIPKTPIEREWEAARCPACNKELGELEGDGYYKNYTSLNICSCGQKLVWAD